MVVSHVASLPDTLLDNILEQRGEDGRLPVQYTRWLSESIEKSGRSKYYPTIHFNLHGALGQIYQNDLGHTLGQLYALIQAAQPYPLCIECPVIMENRQDQIEAIKTL
jgi:methylaspartate ammonia-lyase